MENYLMNLVATVVLVTKVFISEQKFNGTLSVILLDFH
jgi:hypothetical protein